MEVMLGTSKYEREVLILDSGAMGSKNESTPADGKKQNGLQAGQKTDIMLDLPRSSPLLSDE
jgi:hypothetical protein